MSEQISGVIERVTYHDTQSGFCVLRVKQKGNRDLTTITGHLPSVHPGEGIHALGVWIIDVQHGRQFKADKIQTSPPLFLDGIEKYLGSGMVRGVGPEMAKRLVKTFGEKVFEVIEQRPHLLTQVNGIGKFRQEKLTKSWQEQKEVRKIMVFLHTNGANTSRAVKIYKTYGNRSIEVVEADPYCLARDIWGIGFKTADLIAQKLGFKGNDPRRIRAGVSFALLTATDQGHCGLPLETLDKSVITLLTPENEPPLITPQEVQEAIEELRTLKEVVLKKIGTTDIVFMRALDHQEMSIARHVLSLLPERMPNAPSIGRIKHIAQQENIILSPSQETALHEISGKKFAILTGGPGVGKTTCLRIFVKALKEKNVTIALAAPTGKAAKRIQEAVGEEAVTLHRLLSYQGGQWFYNKDNPLPYDYLIIDECSMIDVPLMYALLQALAPHTALLMVGDPNQLPPVGAGLAFGDMVDTLPHATLTEIHRQAAGSDIIQAAHAINQGRMPTLKNTKKTDLFFEEMKESISEQVAELVQKRLPMYFQYDPIRDIQVITPMRRGMGGMNELNALLQQRLNGHKAVEIEKFGTRFLQGDKVMQRKNNYDLDVMNGDIGIVGTANRVDQMLRVDFDGKQVDYPFDTLDELELAYSYTIHKSQGSEAPCIVLPFSMKHYNMLTRNLLYTAITRGKKTVVIVGEKKAIWIAVNNKNTAPRWTQLAGLLRENFRDCLKGS